MDIFLTVIVLALIAIAILTGQTKNSLPSQPQLTPDGQTTPSSPSATPPPVKVNPSPLDINALRYPNSIVTAESVNRLSIESADNPDTITNWYKEKIKSLGVNTKSFVTTKTNDNVLNNLTGASEKAKITVKITKPAGASTVSIDVVIFSP